MSEHDKYRLALLSKASGIETEIEPQGVYFIFPEKRPHGEIVGPCLPNDSSLRTASKLKEFFDESAILYDLATEKIPEVTR